MTQITKNDTKISRLENELKRTRALLTNTVDTLNEERSHIAATKNRVAGGYYMMSRRAEKNLRNLQQANPTASLLFSVIREHMQIGTNALTISNNALCKIIGKSRATVTRAVNYLSTHNYVQIVKVGNVNTYVVNERIAFAGNVGQRKAVFSATVIADEIEQEEGWEKVEKLKAVPLIVDIEEFKLCH